MQADRANKRLVDLDDPRVLFVDLVLNPRLGGMLRDCAHLFWISAKHGLNFRRIAQGEPRGNIVRARRPQNDPWAL